MRCSPPPHSDLGPPAHYAHAMPSATVTVGGRYAPIPSPASLPPESPYSPQSCSRSQTRMNSTDSARTCSSSASTTSSASTSVNLQESLAEFQELQNKIKQERDAVNIASPPPYPGSPKAGSSTTTTTKATMQIKIEPVESSSFGLPPPPPAYPTRERESSEEGGSNVNIKMEPVLSLAFEQVKKDIDDACKMMGISPSKYN